MDLVLAGCGSAAIYWLGHVLVLRHASVDVGRVYATSSGALVGAILLCEVDVALCLRALRAMRDRRWVAVAMHEALMALLPPDAHVTCSGRLHVRTTRLGVMPTTVCTQHYATRADLLDVLYAATVIPLVTAPVLGHVMRDGTRHVDGLMPPMPERRKGYELVALPVAIQSASTSLPTAEEIDVAVVRGVHAMLARLKLDGAGLSFDLGGELRDN